LDDFDFDRKLLNHWEKVNIKKFIFSPLFLGLVEKVILLYKYIQGAVK